MLKNIKNKPKKNKKGFTLIELIVVMAVIGILVLVAAPKFIGYTQKAELTKIQNDSRVVGTLVDAHLAGGEELVAGTTLSDVELNSFASEGKLYDLKGPVESARPGTYTLLSKEFSGDSKLKGEFYSNDMGDIYYVGTRAIGGNTPAEGNEAAPEGDVLSVGMLQDEIDWLSMSYVPWDYTPESFETFEWAIAVAQGVVDSGTPTQQEIQNELTSLEDAVNQLELKEVAPLEAQIDVEALANSLWVQNFSNEDSIVSGMMTMTVVNDSAYTMSLMDSEAGAYHEIPAYQSVNLSLTYYADMTYTHMIMFEKATEAGMQIADYSLDVTTPTSAEINFSTSSIF